MSRPFTVFRDRYGRWMRIVWRGITRVRLQDNRGRNYICTYQELNHIL